MFGGGGSGSSGRGPGLIPLARGVRDCCFSWVALLEGDWTDSSVTLWLIQIQRSLFCFKKNAVSSCSENAILICSYACVVIFFFTHSLFL